MSRDHSRHLSSGELFTLAVLDREREAEYNLVAKATDGGGRSCQADIALRIQDTNDNPPLFSSSHYEVTVFDNTTARTPIAVMYARDPDTGETQRVETQTCLCVSVPAYECAITDPAHNNTLGPA